MENDIDIDEDFNELDIDISDFAESEESAMKYIIPLIKKSSKDGFTTYAKLKSVLPENCSAELLSDAIFQLEELKISVVDGIEGEMRNTASESSIPKSIDPLNAYMRSIGNNTTLSREEEVLLAKSIEDNNFLILKLISTLNPFMNEIVSVADEINANRVLIREVVDVNGLYSRIVLRQNEDEDVQNILNADHSKKGVKYEFEEKVMSMRSKSLEYQDFGDDSIEEEIDGVGDDASSISSMEKAVKNYVMEAFTDCYNISIKIMRIQKDILYGESHEDGLLDGLYNELFEKVKDIKLHSKVIQTISQKIVDINQAIIEHESHLLSICDQYRVSRGEFLDIYDTIGIHDSICDVFSAVKSKNIEKMLNEKKEIILNIKKEIDIIVKKQIGIELKKFKLIVRQLDNIRMTVNETKEKIIQANLKLVVTIVRKCLNSRRELTILDAIQEGNIGLMNAVEKFDYRKGYRFITYATLWIRQRVARAQQKARSMQLPAHMIDIISRIKRITKDLQKTLKRDPTPEEVANKAGIKVEKLHKIEQMSIEIRSLDNVLDPNDDSGSMEDLIGSDAPSPEDFAEKMHVREVVNKVLMTLDARSAAILRRRFGIITNEKTSTLEDIGEEYDVTRERIRQIEAKALRKLRHPSRSKVFVDKNDSKHKFDDADQFKFREDNYYDD